ncbi:MAG: hypothetical protein Q9220_007108 [cf. Caloplaca sp. 1 TL-2023]
MGPSSPMLFLLSLFFALISLAAALPANPPSSSSSQTLTETLSPQNLTVNPNFLCKPNPPFKTSISPTLGNCAAAMRGFPADSELAHFHNGGAGDGFQLPLFQRYKDCEVLVLLKDTSAQPIASWAEIGLAMVEVGMACANTGNVGGTTTAGDGEGIEITVRGYPLPK